MWALHPKVSHRSAVQARADCSGKWSGQEEDMESAGWCSQNGRPFFVFPFFSKIRTALQPSWSAALAFSPVTYLPLLLRTINLQTCRGCHTLDSSPLHCPAPTVRLRRLLCVGHVERFGLCRLLNRYYLPALFSRGGKTFTLSVAAGLAVLGGFGLSGLEMGLEPQLAAPTDFYLQASFCLFCLLGLTFTGRYCVACFPPFP